MSPEAPAGAPPAWFIYYKVAESDLAAACAAARAMQQQLCADWPGLEAELLRRPEASPQGCTLMEIYRLDAGSTAHAAATGLPAAIAQAAQALQPWQRGERHSEGFVPCA